MNIASSNINQWTLLFAMLPIVFSLSRGTPFRHSRSIREQQAELLLTIGQSLVGAGVPPQHEVRLVGSAGDVCAVCCTVCVAASVRRPKYNLDHRAFLVWTAWSHQDAAFAAAGRLPVEALRDLEKTRRA